ncbi:MAG: hypothetical protein RLZ83_632 [Pseudomonadota bacterium]|jgi:hypothetical protein
MGRAERVLSVLWPAFVMAGALETLVFAMVDPQTLTWFGGEPVGWSRQAVYTVSFFVFWGVIAAASALTAALSCEVRNVRESEAASAPRPG